MLIDLCSFVTFRRDEVIRREAKRTEEEKLVMDSVTGMSNIERKKTVR